MAIIIEHATVGNTDDYEIVGIMPTTEQAMSAAYRMANDAMRIWCKGSTCSLEPTRNGFEVGSDGKRFKWIVVEED
jgi:hypothetical protein